MNLHGKPPLLFQASSIEASSSIFCNRSSVALLRRRNLRGQRLYRIASLPRERHSRLGMQRPDELRGYPPEMSINIREVRNASRDWQFMAEAHKVPAYETRPRDA
jgi:hypothetical protein